MNIKVICLLSILLFAGWLLPAAAADHPSTGLPLRELPQGYLDGFVHGASMSQGDLQFPERFPAPETLSAAERFLVAGLEQPTAQCPYTDYLTEVFLVVDAYCALEGGVPPALSREVIDAAKGGEAPAALHAFLRSPLTGEYPRLDAAQPAPGQLYVRRLTDAEIRRHAEFHYNLKQACVEGEVYDSATREWVPGGLISGVYYFRLYGHDGVIAAGVKFATAPDKL